MIAAKLPRAAIAIAVEAPPRLPSPCLMKLVRQLPFSRPRRGHPPLAVLAIATGVWAAAGIGPVFGPRVFRCPFGESRTDVARMTIAKYVYEAYPEWRSLTKRDCPEALAELDGFMNPRTGIDPWGNPYHFTCGPKMVPAGARPFWVISAGEDGKFGTDDDIRSDR